MTTDLVPPSSLAGFSIGDPIVEQDLSQFVEDGEDEGCMNLTKFSPYVSVVVCDGVVVSVTAADECWLGGIDLVGVPVGEAIDLLGTDVLGREGSPVEIWALAGGIELYARNDVVTRVSLSDWSLVNGYQGDGEARTYAELVSRSARRSGASDWSAQSPVRRHGESHDDRLSVDQGFGITASTYQRRIKFACRSRFACFSPRAFARLIDRPKCWCRGRCRDESAPRSERRRAN